MTLRRGRLRWMGWAIAIVVLAGGGYLGLRQRRAESATAIPEGVQVATAARGTIQRRIHATGVVAAQTGAIVKIGSQITGRIRSLPADVGSRVRAGQVVAILDSPDLQAQVDQQRHNADAAAASLEQARSRLKQAGESAELSKEQTAAQVAEADAALNAARSRVETSAATAKLQPTQTAAEITRAEAALSTARSVRTQAEQTARQQIQQAQAAVDEARFSLENTRRSLTRQEELLKRGFVADQAVDNSRTAALQAEARMENATASLAIAREKTQADLQAARDQVSQAEANLAAARASRLQDAMRRADLQAARESLLQARATLSLRRASRTEDRRREMAIQEARSEVARAMASLQQARAQLSYQRAQWEKTVIRSPIEGTVLSITAQQGETVAAGLSAPTLITVANLDRLEVRAYVDETDIGRIRLGVPAEVRVEAFPSRVFHGRITKIAGASTVKENVVTYETTVALRDAGGVLRPDMTADVTLLLGQRADALLVPSEAVHRQIERSIVYVLHRRRQGKERIEIRPVQPGIDDGLRVELREGLAPGEEVVLAGVARFGVTPVDEQGGGPGGARR